MPSTIAFGSCAKQTRKQPVWERIVRQKPDLFIFTGDTVYADTHKEAKIRQAYAALDSKPGFKILRERCEILGTWDDHDYGKNDEGEENPAKVASQAVLLDFLRVPGDSERRSRKGVYHEQVYTGGGRTLQVVVLDTRYFRSPLKSTGKRHRYIPDETPGKTILGEAQWDWLEGVLKKPADLRIVVTSIQLVAEQHPFEKWANLPLERQRFFDLVRSVGAKGVVCISGDRHMAEISVLEGAVGYPLADITSSGLTQAGGGANEENRHRIGSVYRKRNFGTVTVDWAAADPLVGLGIRDAVSGEMMVEHSFRLSELQ